MRDHQYIVVKDEEEFFDLEKYLKNNAMFEYCWYEKKEKLLPYGDGGYPLYYIDGFNSVLCADCATKSLKNLHDTDLRFKPKDYGVNYEDPDLYCDDCPQRIKSAYSVPDEENLESEEQ